MMKITLIVFSVSLLLFFVYCDEDWPPFKDHIQKISATLECYTDGRHLRTPYQTNLGFRIIIFNDSDETLFFTHNFSGKLYCWRTAMPGRVAEFEFEMLQVKKEYTILPQKSISIPFNYNLSLGDGSFLWDTATIPGPDSYEAYAEIHIIDIHLLLPVDTTGFTVFYDG